MKQLIQSLYKGIREEEGSKTNLTKTIKTSFGIFFKQVRYEEARTFRLLAIRFIVKLLFYIT